ncbi:MAG: insulinase family protein, partial [Cyclobacteriaceae bacterium]|nr:insulinase family protein [Cyclobacteriaceae bacterium]
ANGMKAYGMENNELPIVNFNIVIEGGHLLDNLDKNGVANLMTDIMMEGTANKTPEELEEEIELLGASINMYTGENMIYIGASTLKRNFSKTMDLIEEILLEPRWDVEEFDRIKLSTINQIQRNSGQPNTVASNVYNKLIYGEKHPLAYPSSGSEESVNSITIDDLKEFYNKNFSPSISRFHIVGAITQEEVVKELKDLETRWEAKEVNIPVFELPAARDKAGLYFVDIPNAKQSVINIGNLSIPRTDPDYYAATVMNYKLGGSFNGNVNLILREEKGYTYGARSGFSGSKYEGTFTASSSVRSNVTFESVQIFKDEIEKYRNGIADEDLEFTKNALINGNARRFETNYAMLGMLQTMSAYDLPADYIKKEEEVVRTMTIENHKDLANKYLNPATMIYLVVGDAATQFGRFEGAGFDEVLLLDKEAQPVEKPIIINTSK